MDGVYLQRQDFKADDHLMFLRCLSGVGAVVHFSGIVRDDEGGQALQMLEIECFEPMCLKTLRTLHAEASVRWRLRGCVIVHRFGNLHVGEQIMMVATAAAHRKEAFLSAQYLMDFLKNRAPFWKKHHYANHSVWVAETIEDAQSLARWSKNTS